ncbi:MAG TPA: hypothetical protein VHJ34_05930 [Actinomycetota bacterium]|nr:hypothetical protein [Actinomycetota bacterium]
MDTAIALSDDAQRTAGILLLTVVAVQSGGLFVLRVLRRRDVTDFQRAFFRAGHAHAGVLVVLSLVCQLYADASGLSGAAEQVARSGVPLAAILMPAGFFLSAAQRGATGPSRWIALLYAGALALAAGVVTLGIGLLA